MGVVHRDIKPANLMLDAAGHLWVTDFGLAKFDAAATLTVSGDLLGTLRYMSPEQALAKHGLVDHRTDVYSLGATLYELLTLRPAVGGADKQETLRQIAFEEPVPPRRLDKAIPAELETVTLKALAKTPDERYASAGELADDLRRWLSHQTIKAKPPTVRQRAAKWAQRHRAVVRAAGAALAAVIALMAVSLVLLVRAWDAADRHRTAAEQKAAALRLRVYATDMRRAHDFWQQGVVHEMIAILKAYDPQPGEADLRGFEWYYLKNLADTRPRLVHTFPAKSGVVYAAVFSPDGRYIATTGEQSVIDLWDAKTFEHRGRLVGHSDDCNSLAFTPDGRLLVSGGDDCTVRIWDVAERRQVGRLDGHTDEVQKVVVSPDGKTIASAAWDETVRLWDVASRAEKDKLNDGGRLYTAAFSPDGKTLASCADPSGLFSLWDISTRQSRGPLAHGFSEATQCAFSPDGTLLAAAGREAIRVWNTQTNGVLFTLGPSGVTQRYLAFATDNSWLVATGDDGRVRVWSMLDGILLGQFLTDPHTDHPRERNWGVAVSADGRSVLIARGNQRAELWELPDRWPRSDAITGPSVPPGWQLALAPDTAAAAFEYPSSTTHNVFVLITDIQRTARLDGVEPKARRGVGQQEQPFAPKWAPMVEVEPKARRGKAQQGLFQFSADELWLAHVHLPERGECSAIQLWDVKAARPAGHAPLRPPPATERVPGGAGTWYPTSLTFARGGQSVLALYADQVLTEWDRKTGTLSSWEGAPPETDAPHGLACSADGRTVVVTGSYRWRPWDAERRRWAGDGGTLERTIKGACVSADGQLLGTCESDGTIRLIDIPSGRERAAIVGQHLVVEHGGMAFSPDGRTLATLSRGAVRLWQVATGLELFALDHTAGGSVVPGPDQYALRFRTDGRALVAAGPWKYRLRMIVWEAAAPD
jgi:WD40 repeat protein